MTECRACPRMCGTRREEGSGAGFCRAGLLPRVARAAAHFGEEPCISGERGSGAVFFSGCNLRCVFCQNRQISAGGFGETVTVGQLADIFRRLEGEGVHNINLVTASHFAESVAGALSRAKLQIPVVWNSSGYDSVGSLKMLEGLVQIYLPDLKYLNSDLARKYSAAADYPQTALAAIDEMYHQTEAFCLDSDGLMKSGVIIRHLVLPGEVENSLDVIDEVAGRYPKDSVLFSLMSQYTPTVELSGFPELARTITREEYERVTEYLSFSGIEAGYLQELSSAGGDHVPGFDLTGIWNGE